MPKNILIFSDGTGQAGGVRPDQRLSNVYKLFRACRGGPDSPIDPEQQLAFYDAGLGTDDDAAGAPTRAIRYLRKLLASATGRGITQNILDCYLDILNNYEPGDRIYIFGFSRGAYTARCVANLLELCGAPTLGYDGAPFPRRKPDTAAIAREAVKTVYEHGAGRPAEKFDAERKELARRFRLKYGSGDESVSNAHPYFVGVFDTVASLGARGFGRVILILGLLLGAAAVSAALAGVISFLAHVPFWRWFIGLSLVGVIGYVISSLRSTLHVIRDFPDKGNVHWHIAKWEMKNYDQRRPQGIRFARHALAIDETRADFPRVKWGWKGVVDERTADEPERFIQMWFAGNHSDIGGSYPEEESRLSDVALSWMRDEALTLPHPILIDQAKLNAFPSPTGIQHCEVDATRDKFAAKLPRWLRRWTPSWKEKLRTEALGAPMHPSVLERFELPGVWKCGTLGRYQPETLREDPRFASFYEGVPCLPAPPRVS